MVATTREVESETEAVLAAGLQEVLDGRHAALRQDVRDALCALDLAAADGMEREAYRDLVLDWCTTLAQKGIGNRSFPKALGGEDDPAGRVAGFQTLGYGDLSLLVKVGVQFGLFGGSVHRLGTDRHHEAYLRDLASLELPGCFAMSESGHGSDVRSIRTMARYDEAAQELVVHTPDDEARKDWIGSAARHARLAVVFAQLDVAGEMRGVHAVLVPLRDEQGNVLDGIEIEDCGDKMGLQGVDNGRIRFHAVRVPRDNLLDRFGKITDDGDYTSPVSNPAARFFTMIGALVEGRICIAGASLSVARSALTIAVRWGERRRQFGTGLDADLPLMDYLTHQRRLLPRIARSYAMQATMDSLTERYADVITEPDPDEQRAVESLAAGLKAYATWEMVAAIQDSRECCGGKGYLAENRFAALRADSDVFTTFEGDNTVLMQLVAKGLIAEYASQFEDLDAVGMVKHLSTRQVGRFFSESGPLGRFVRDDAELRTSEWQAAALAFREERMVDALARRLRKLTGEGIDPQRALIVCQDHALAAARSSVERQVHELWTARVTSVEGETGEVLRCVADLSALSMIERDRGWWLEHGFLTGDDSRALQKEVNALCAELRPHALDLVAGFGIPDALLRAPIAIAEQTGGAGTD